MYSSKDMAGEAEDLAHIEPRIPAYREAGWGSRSDNASYVNAYRLERRSEIQDRIAYLTRQEEDLVVEKRRRIEEQLWADPRSQ
jgi:hypothetical protein